MKKVRLNKTLHWETAQPGIVRWTDLLGVRIISYEDFGDHDLIGYTARGTPQPTDLGEEVAAELLLPITDVALDEVLSDRKSIRCKQVQSLKDLRDSGGLRIHPQTEKILDSLCETRPSSREFAPDPTWF